MSYENLIKDIDNLSVRVAELLAEAEMLKTEIKRLNKLLDEKEVLSNRRNLR